jgi:type I restriction enzyme, S subunit
MSFPRYAKYQDSGIDWVDKTPSHWNRTRVKYVARPGSKTFIDGDWIEAPFITNDGVRLLQCGNVGTGIFEEQGFRYISEDTFSDFDCTEVKPNDVLICRLQSSRTILAGRACLAPRLDVKMITSVDNCILKPSSDFDPRYIVYQLSTSAYLSFIEVIARGGTRDRISRSMLGDIELVAPPVTEQAAIAEFLDRETAKIDALVGEQRRLIELLKEKRQAVISHAVTKGLNPHAPLKPSAIEWLGDVPARWSTRTIAKASSKITNGYVGPTRDILVETGVPYIQATHIKGGRINFDDGYFVTPEWSNTHSKSILAEEDVLIVQTGAGTGDVGLVSKNEVGYNCHALIIVTPDHSVLRGAFLSAVLQSTYGQERLTSIQTGAMHPHLNCGEVKFVETPLPPLAEQFEIVAYIREAAYRFDALIAEAQRAIDLLQERRSALISAAVTGKIDVRGLAESEAA